MAFRTVGLLDSFKRAAEDPVSDGGAWTVINGMLHTGQIAGATEAYASADAFAEGEDGAFWNSTQFVSPAVAAYLDHIAGASRTLVLWVCLGSPTTASKSGYCLRVEGESETKVTLTVEKMVEGVLTVLSKTTAVTVAVGDLVGLEVKSGNVIAWHKKGAEAWAEVSSKADATYVRGYVGIGAKGSAGMAARNFEAGGGVSLSGSVKSTSGFTALPRGPSGALGAAALGAFALGGGPVGALVTHEQLSGTVAATSAFTAGIRPRLAGVINISASFSATLSERVKLTGTVAATSAFTATLGTRSQFAGSITSTASFSGALSEHPLFAGTIASSASFSGALHTRVLLNGTVASTATFTGALSSPTLLAGSIASTSSFAGALSTPTKLTGTLDASASFTGEMHAPVLLGGVISSNTSFLATLRERVVLTGIVAGHANFAGALHAKGFTGSFTGVATFTSALTISSPEGEEKARAEEERLEAQPITVGASRVGHIVNWQGTGC